MFRLAAALALLCLPASASAQVFSVHNQAALARGFALPVLGDAQILPPGAAQGRVQLDLTNEYYQTSTAREQLTLDGETARLTLGYRRGWGPGLEAALRVPLLSQGGGFLDGFIEDWHATFGLPNAGRERAPQDRYRYRYQRDGVTLLERSRSESGLGDVELALGWQLRPGQALRTMLKLPTGDADALRGGALGGALWLDGALPFAAESRLSGTYSLGVAGQERAGALQGLQQTVTGLGGLGLAVRLWPRLHALAQVYAHTPLYRGSETDLSRLGLQLVFGGRLRLGQTLDLDLAIQEDVVVNSSPDFSLHLGLAARYR